MNQEQLPKKTLHDIQLYMNDELYKFLNTALKEHDIPENLTFEYFLVGLLALPDVLQCIIHNAGKNIIFYTNQYGYTQEDVSDFVAYSNEMAQLEAIQIAANLEIEAMLDEMATNDKNSPDYKSN